MFECALLELVVVGEVGGVGGRFNEVEIAAHDEVHVVGDGVKVFKLARSAGVVIIARGEVEVEEAVGEEGLGVGGPWLEADALSLPT